MTPKHYPFNIAISIAFVGLCVTFCVWFGTINKTIEMQSKEIQSQEQQIKDLLQEQRDQDRRIDFIEARMDGKTKQP